MRPNLCIRKADTALAADKICYLAPGENLCDGYFVWPIPEIYILRLGKLANE
jgi:hypothetical protein